MLAVGAAVGAGRLSWWVAVLVVELIAVAGTAVLLLAVPGTLSRFPCKPAAIL
jgi:phosphate/sulfate permease